MALLGDSSLLSKVSDIIRDTENQYINKIEVLSQENDQLQAQIDELQQQIDPYGSVKDDDFDSMLTELDNEQKRADGNDEDMEEEKKLDENDIEYVKDLIRSKELNMHESGRGGFSRNRTLLMMATDAGNYELVSMCINLGADIEKIDWDNKTALKIAKERGFPQIEELLLMNLLKTELGERIENTTNDILKKKGITQNFKKMLDKLFNERDEEKEGGFLKGMAVSNSFLSAFQGIYKKEMLETMLQIVLKSIETKTAYSDDMLFIAFEYEMSKKGKKPVETDCFRVIKKVITDILADTTNKTDWYWLKNYILASSIWYFRVDPNDIKSNFLYDEVFKLVEEETKRQSAILSEPMRGIEQKNISEWNRLISYDVKTDYDHDQVRQDAIDRGLRAEYMAEELTQNVSLSGAFNPLIHYDLSQYLTKLILICHEVDDQFQYDMQRIFNIDKATKQNKEMKLQYMRGPVKKLTRCNAKCLSDYREMQFPTAAHVLDIIRCSLVFGDVSSMLKGMDRFIQKMKTKLYCILEVVRVKNRFLTDYKHETASYTDVKFNVMIKGKKYNIVGEVQFLFKEMFDYKKIAHSLYSIERTKEFVDDLNDVLPIKEDLEKQLFIHAAKNNVNGLTDLMVTHNFTPTQLLKPNRQKQSILTSICDLNCQKVLSFLSKIVPLDVIRNSLMTQEENGQFPLKRAIAANHLHGVLRQIFENDQFGLIASKEHRQKALMICWELKRGKCALLILENIQNTKERLAMIESNGTNVSSLQYILKCGDLDLLKYVFELMEGDKKMMNTLLKFRDSDGKNNFHYAAEGGNVECIKYLTSKCQTESQKNCLFLAADYEKRWGVNEGGLTPLHLAIVSYKPENAKYILDQMNDTEKEKFFETRVEMNKDDRWSRTTKPFSWLLKCSASDDGFATVKALVNYIPIDDGSVKTAFLYAAKYDQVDLGKQIIAKTSDDYKQTVIDYQEPNEYPHYGNCALHNAVGQNSLAFLEWLLSIIDIENKQFTLKNRGGDTPLIIASRYCHLKCAKLILDKVKENAKELLSMTDNKGVNCIQMALGSRAKHKAAMVRMMIKYYDDNNYESIFLPSLQLGDLELAQQIWDKTNGDKELQQRLLNNCFSLVCKEGALKSLQWLLTLSDEEKNEANLTQKSEKLGMSPILSCVGSWKVADKNENHHQCVKLIFEKVKNKKGLIFDTDIKGRNILMHACLNANEQAASFILSKTNDRMKKQLIEVVHKGNARSDPRNTFHCGIEGGNLKLTKKIYDLFKKYGKDKQLRNDSMMIKLALTAGNVEMSEWLIFTVIKDTKTAIKCLNDNILRAKKVHTFTQALKGWLNKLMNSLKVIEDPKTITNIFNWIVDNVEDKNTLQLIISKFPHDNDIKGVFFKNTNCLSTACRKNRQFLLEQLLKFMGDLVEPLLDTNVFYEAINSGNDECAEIILKSQKKQSVKDKLLMAKTSKENETALDSAIKKKSQTAIDLILDNYSKSELLISDAFIKCFKQRDVKIAKHLLTKTKSKSEILNRKLDGGNSLLMVAVKAKESDCLQFIVDELKNEEKINGSSTVHPVYLTKNDEGNNIFHEMFKNECSMKNIKILETALNQQTVYKLLLERNMNDELPVYCAFLKQETEILEWILNQFDDATEKYRMITQRNKFHKTLLQKTSKNAQMAESKLFLAKVIYKCLEQIDWDNLETVLLKDTFHYTITWKYSDLQKLILDETPLDQCNQLLNRDGILHNNGQPVLHQIVETDDVELYKLLLSKLKDIDVLMFRNNSKQNIVEYAISKGVGHECIKLILDKIYKKGKDFFVEIVTPKFLGLIYRRGDKKYENVILSYFDDWDKRLALHAAIPYDKEFTFVPRILASLEKNDKDIRRKVIRWVDDDGENILHKSMSRDLRKVFEWILNDEIKEVDDPMLFVRNKHRSSILSCIARQRGSNELIDLYLSKMSLKNRWIQLKNSWNLSNEYVSIKVISEVVASINVIEDEEMVTDLFEFCLHRITGPGKTKALKLLLDKVTDEIREKLVCSNDIRALRNAALHKEKKDIFALLLECVPKSQRTDILMKVEEGSLSLIKKGDYVEVRSREDGKWHLGMVLGVHEDDDRGPGGIRVIYNYKNGWHYWSNVRISEDSILRNVNFLQTLCLAEYDLDTFKSVLEYFEDPHQELMRCDHKNKSMLFYAINTFDIAQYILQQIKSDNEKMQIFNHETRIAGNSEGTIFDVVHNEKVKEMIKTQITEILNNIETNKLRAGDFANYFKWRCKENDLDSLKLVVSTFKIDTKSIHRLIESKFGRSAQTLLQIACSPWNTEILEYFLTFVDRKNAKLLTYVAGDNSSAIYECFKLAKYKHLKLIISKLKTIGFTQNLSDLLMKQVDFVQCAIDAEIKQYNCNKTDFTKVILESGFSISVPVILTVFFAMLKNDKTEFIEKHILSKLKQLGVSKKTLFGHFDKDGNNALFISLEKGNSKLVQIILDEIDKTDDKAIANFVNLRNDKGQSLMHVAAQSKNLNCVKALLSICEGFFNNKITLLLAVDHDGNNALHTYLNTISSSKTSEIENFVTFYLSNIKKQSDKFKLITQSNNDRKVPFDAESLTESKFGCALIERLLKKIDFATEQNIELWSKLLRLSITCSYNSSSIRKLILDKYPNDKIKLLSLTNEKFQNSLYLAAMKSKQTLHDILKYVGKDNAHLLLQPSYSSSKDGQTILHKLADTERLTMIMSKFESPMDVISLCDDNNQSVLQKMQRLWMNEKVQINDIAPLFNQQYMDETKICQMFVDTEGGHNILWRYIEDHRNEIVPKLIWCRETESNKNILMVLVRMAGNWRGSSYGWDLIWPYIEKLSDKDKMKLMTQTDTTGLTALHYATDWLKSKHNGIFEQILSLFPDAKAKKDAILQRSMFGSICLMNSSQPEIAKMLWNEVSFEDRLKAISSSVLSKPNPAILGLFVADLKKMPKDAKVADTSSLVWMFRSAVKKDKEFAQLIVSKIDTAKQENVLKFLTTKVRSGSAEEDGETVFHFAARNVDKEDPFLLQLLFDLMDKAGIDSQKMLLNEEVMCNKQRLTPLAIVVESEYYTKPKIVEFILSKIKNKNDRMKFIEIESIYHKEEQIEIESGTLYEPYEWRYNVINNALDHIDLLKVLLKDYGKKDIKRIMENKNGQIYLSMRQKSFEYLHDSFKLKSGFKQFSAKCNEGNAPFIEWAKHTNPQFIEKILSLCKNDDERIKLIYQLNDEGDNALIRANAKNKRFLTKWIKNSISSMRNIKDLDLHIPIFLYALRVEDIDLAQMLLSTLSSKSDKSKLMNCQNEFGLNGVLIACKYGKYQSLKFLLDDNLFDSENVFVKDFEGRSAIHYCFGSWSDSSMTCFGRLISCYEQKYNKKQIKSQKWMMFAKDKNNRYPMSYAFENENFESKLVKWAIMRSMNDIAKGHTRNELIMRMLFGENDSSSLLEFKVSYNLMIARCIKLYFDGIKQLNDDSLKFAAYSIFFLRGYNWTLTKSIIAKCVDKEQRDKLMNFKNSDNETVLHRIVGYGKISTDKHQIIVWYLTEVISDDHPMLFVQDSINGKTILMRFIECKSIPFAQTLLDKVKSKEDKMKLIQMVDAEEMNISDRAKLYGYYSVNEWIQQQID